MSAPRFVIRESGLAGLKVIERCLLEDARGSLSRFFSADAFREMGFTDPINQINLTVTKRMGTVRGLHFQHPPHAEIKVVSCLRGRIFDVGVDLRRDSPTFLQWRGAILSGENHTSLLVPHGFAHGFQTLEPDCELLYLHSAPHTPEAEDGLHPMDPALAISWPLEIAELSEKDRGRAFIARDYLGISL